MYPAYVRAHERLLTGGDVEAGQPSGTVKDLVLLDCEKMRMDDVFEKACSAVLDASR